MNNFYKLLNNHVMIIRYQERYDQVVEYAKRIDDTTFQNCIERLKQ